MNLEGVKEIRIIQLGFPEKKTEEEINKLLKEGWRLLQIGEDGSTHDGIDIIYTLGKFEAVINKEILLEMIEDIEEALDRNDITEMLNRLAKLEEYVRFGRLNK